MQTSAQGIAALEAEESVVLRAYRDPVGVWTIGAGLTAASGVVTPKAGMVITAAGATNLLQRALRQKYEPAVEIAMSQTQGGVVVRPKQHEFDAGVLFHWNTGAIARASWVRAWKAKQPDAVIRAALLLWTKAGGKVLRGLQRRRAREADILLNGIYPAQGARAVTGFALPAPPAWGDLAVFPANIDAAARLKAAQRLIALGYQSRDGDVTAYGARQFQRDHGLNVDGIIGRATIDTLQRRTDAASKAVLAAPAGVGLAGVSIIPGVAAWMLGLAAAALCLWVIWQAWHYRDAIAAKIQSRLPRLANFLRSL